MNPHRRILLFAALAALAFPAAPRAAAPDVAEQAEQEHLMAILNEETAVATKTRQNSDFVPGMVTVLHGDELEALGVETVWEALSLVPGMQTFRSAEGSPTVIVRGIDFPFNSGNVKVLVNSIPLSRESAGINGIALQIPVQQVDRIEIIRGPGSVIYGDFAFMGLVNIITRNEGVRGYARAGGDHARAAGAQVCWGKPDDRWGVALGAAGWQSKDAPVVEPAGAEEQRGFATLAAHYGDFSLTAETVRRLFDQTLPPGATGLDVDQTHWAVALRHARDWTPALHTELHVSHLDNHFKGTIVSFEGRVSEAGLDVNWTGWTHQGWLLGVDYSDADIDSASFNFPPPPPPLPPLPPLVIRNEKRRIFGATLQDRIDLGDSVTVTAGGRYDTYSDIGDRVTPRLAVAWRMTDRDILKFQYAEGFRAPTFFELYGQGKRDPNLDFEINGTSELNYIHRQPRLVFRATLFDTRIRDMIFVHGPGVFGNINEARARGAELEWEQEVTDTLKLLANFSAAKAHDDRDNTTTERDIPATADYLWNAAALWRMTPKTLLTARWNHVGARHAPESPHGYETLDLSGNRQDLFIEGLDLRAGVKNMFDGDVRYIYTDPRGNAVLNFPGRTFWAQLAYRWR